jgi:hypothetical protein
MAFDPVFPDEVRIEARLGNGLVWTEIPDVVLASPISIDRGNSGTTQKDRVATTGSMSFALNNAEDNSAGLLGLYSPNNPNALIGWGVGIPVRCVMDYDGVDYTLFVGVVEAIEPMSGKFRDRRVSVSCTDWMEEASRSKIRGLPLQIGERSSRVFEVVALGVERQPVGGYDIKPGADVFPYSLDSAHEGEVNAMSEFQRIAQSELGRVYVNREGTVVYEGRHFRPNLQTIFIALTDEDIVGVEAGRGREEVINHAEIEVHPRRVDATPTTVLSELAGAKKIERNTSAEVNILMRDPESRATRVGGRDMVQPVPTTDYLFNSVEDGTGIDLTSQLTVVVVFSANGGEATITNNGPQDGYLTKLQTRGRGIYDYETVQVKSDSQASKDKYGEAGFSLDMPYQANFGIAQDAADFVVQQSKELLTQIRAVRFNANREDRLMLAALTGDISNKITLQETVIGTQAFLLTGEDEGQVQQIAATKFFINAVKLDIQERRIVTCTWTLEPGDPFAYWILEVLGSTELEQTTRLAYGSFQLAWVLDFDFLGTTTRLGDS